MEVVRRREEVGAVLLPVAVIERQQIGHGLVSLCVFQTSMPKKIPTPTEKAVLQKADLGFKKIKFDFEADEVSVCNQLVSSSSSNSQPDELTSGHFQLQNCGGFELMKCKPNCKVLEPLECQISAKNLKAAAGQGKIYIRPIQRSLSVLPLKSEASPCSTSALKEKCVHCYKEYPLNVLRSHVLSCLSSNYLLSDESDEGSDIVNDHSSIEIRTSSENGEHGDNLQLQSENEEIHSNESPPVREEQQNSVREINIYDEINNIIQYCKEQDFHNPVEILKYLQENLGQGRPLEIADVSQCIDGATNFIIVDRSNLLNTATEEIRHLQNKFLILEVQFYNEV